MDFAIVWTNQALQDLRDIVRYIALDDPAIARRFGNFLISKAETLITFPFIGRMVPEFREHLLREILIPPYRIVYEINEPEHSLAILRIWHGARGEIEI